MNIETARRFVLQNPDARYKGHAKHATFLQAEEAIEQYKREKATELDAGRLVLDNPNWGRMRR
jgi:hypothetical protein